MKDALCSGQGVRALSLGGAVRVAASIQVGATPPTKILSFMSPIKHYCLQNYLINIRLLLSLMFLLQ